MSESAPITSLVVAAGAGIRLSGDVPKGFRRLGGTPLFLHSLVTFDRSASVDSHVLVVPDKRVDEARGGISGDAVRKPVEIVPGGPSRQDSVLRGLEAARRIEGEALRFRAAVSGRIVAVHDAARPFVSSELIERMIAAARTSGAAVPVTMASDTVREVDPEGGPPRLLDRELVRLAQTPQTARLDWLLEAYAKAERERVCVSDEGAALERAGFGFSLVEGCASNIKITTAEDLAAAEAIVAARRERPRTRTRVGFGEDRHPRTVERSFVLAGVVLDDENGPAGHSDGDPLCHALVDALLGAAADGTIGDHFPDSDPRWSNAAGIDLLSRAVERLDLLGWRVVNVDAVLVADAPHLSPYVPEIRRRLCVALRVGEERVSVKGKRAEGLGFEGTGRGVACRAIALLEAAEP